MVYFVALEIIADNFTPESPGKATVSCQFFRKKTSLSRQKLIRILKFCEKKDRLFVVEDGRSLSLNCPRFADLCDEYTRKQLRSKSGECPDQHPENVRAEVRSKIKDKDKKKTNINITRGAREGEGLVEVIWGFFKKHEDKWAPDEERDKKWIVERILSGDTFRGMDIRFHAASWADWVSDRRSQGKGPKGGKFPVNYKSSLLNWLKGQADKQRGQGITYTGWSEEGKYCVEHGTYLGHDKCPRCM